LIHYFPENKGNDFRLLDKHFPPFFCSKKSFVRKNPQLKKIFFNSFPVSRKIAIFVSLFLGSSKMSFMQTYIITQNFSKWQI